MDCMTEPGCNLCCKLIGVKPIQKPAYRMCAHACKGSGCGIYEDRPDDCKTFECLWLQTQRLDDPMIAAFKPSVCGAIMVPAENDRALVIHVNDGVDWRAGKLGTFVKKMSYRITIIIRHRYSLWVISENRVVGEDRRFGVGQEDNDIVRFEVDRLPIRSRRIAVP